MTEAEMVQRWTAAADEVALLFAYEPDEKVDAELARMRERMIDQFMALYPAATRETMAAGVETIIDTIRDRRREIERGAIAVRSKN